MFDSYLVKTDLAGDCVSGTLSSTRLTLGSLLVLSSTECLSLTVAVGAQEAEIFKTIVRDITTDMVELQAQALVKPMAPIAAFALILDCRHLHHALLDLTRGTIWSLDEEVLIRDLLQRDNTSKV